VELPPFLLDQWLAAYEFRQPPIRYNLASSTGPRWTLGQLQRLDGPLDLDSIAVSYAPPQGSDELRRAIAEHHDVDPDWVIVTTGAAEALSILFCLASRPGGEIALPEPGFPAFAAMARAWQLRVTPYLLDRAGGFEQTAELVLDSLGGDPVLALVNSPHNPTGSIMPRSEVETLASALAERNVPLIVDEVYHPLYFGKDQRSAAGIRNAIVIGDMSKALSLAGLRIGWIIDRDAERRERIIDARSYLTISSSPISEAIAAHALRNRAVILSRLEQVASSNLAKLQTVIAAAPHVLSWVPPVGGTVAYPWLVGGGTTRRFCEKLAEAGVLVAPGDCFGQPDHLRIGFGAEEGGFNQAVAILARGLAAIPA
jgi:aspartate/methionine/tyrosine aminotransferase